MKTYGTAIKIRISVEARQLFQAEADSRDLKFADIVREAMNEFIGSHNLKVKHVSGRIDKILGKGGIAS
jgi:hypothetical protein